MTNNEIESLKESVLASVEQLIGDARGNLRQILESIEADLAAFSSDDADQIEAIAMRVRTAIRRSQVDALRAADDAIYAAIGTGLRILIAAL